MSNFLELAQTLQMTVKALQMYSPTHPRAIATLQSLTGAVQSWLQEKPTLHLAATNGKMFVDGAPVEGQSLHVQALGRQLSERQISGFVIQPGVSEEELMSMLQILILKPAKLEEQGGVARVMADLQLKNITLSQTQYREVREGQGGEEETAAPPTTKALKEIKEPPTPEQQAAALAAQIQAASTPLLLGVAAALRQWKVQLLAASDQLVLPASSAASLPTGEGGEETSSGVGRRLNRIPAADLSGLGAFARETGWTDGFPTEPQLEALRQALASLPAETRLSVLKGLDSAPALPAGLRKGLEALIPELFGGAAADLVSQGATWKNLREDLFELLVSMPVKQQPMLANFETNLRQQALDMGCIQDLVLRLEWEGQSLDGRIQIASKGDNLWHLNPPQRLELLRELFEKGRIEPFMRLLEEITASLMHDEPRLREAAASTLSGVTPWISEPGFPPEAEGLLQQALTAHFGWEPVLHIHRLTEEATSGILGGLLQTGEPAQAQNLILELEGLCAFLEGNQEWRQQALTRLKGRLTSLEMLGLAAEVLHRADPMAVLSVFAPYFEFLGPLAAAWLVRALGEEPDRKRRGRLLEIIRALGPMAMPALQDGLHSPVWYLVRNTLNLLSEMGDAKLLEEVARCLDHQDGRVRRAAVRALWKLGGPASAPPLITVFPISDPETQLEILFGFSHIQSAEAVPVLGEFAANSQTPDKMRIKTAEVLGQIGHPAAIPFLTDLIRRRGRIFTSAEPLELRLAAAQALILINTPIALSALKKLVADEPRGQAREAFARLLPAQTP